ncbi:MAG: GntR family transcriptional regulator [Candidatus Eremiobacteraeota bacterium]|nr:GntR family transcriptional regulator [Candidatus Eremiobacteraeota bacterium]
MSELFLEVDPDIETAPFQQIFEQLRGFIERGDLRPGDLLPTVRQLAGDLGVAPNTVARAYAELQRDGWLASEGRRGTRVAQQTPATNKRARARALREVVDQFVTTLAHRGYSESEVAGALQRFVRS